MAMICDFQILRPQFESTHTATLEWIVKAHTQAEELYCLQKNLPFNKSEFLEKLKKELLSVACKPGVIQKRGHELPDFLHDNWDQMQVYQLNLYPQGVGLKVRQELHGKYTDSAFDKFYSTEAPQPDDLIHVSCTGYVAPSSAQKLVSKKGWGFTTCVTHAYHMGCYGSIPACRMAEGFLQQKKKRVDVVHTELCAFHFNPLLHSREQLVAQSLFADGYIKYSLTHKKEQHNNSALKVLAIYEEIIPDSVDAMQWFIADWGFQLVLSKEIPAFIAKNVKSYLLQLCLRAGCDFQEMLEKALFAIHPGGPKILDYIQKIFQLSDEQLFYSRQILKHYGNVSSATLPYMWEAICADPAVAAKTKVVSLAFGPGLTIAGMLGEKEEV